MRHSSGNSFTEVVLGIIGIQILIFIIAVVATFFKKLISKDSKKEGDDKDESNS